MPAGGLLAFAKMSAPGIASISPIPKVCGVNRLAVTLASGGTISWQVGEIDWA